MGLFPILFLTCQILISLKTCVTPIGIRNFGTWVFQEAKNAMHCSCLLDRKLERGARAIDNTASRELALHMNYLG